MYTSSLFPACLLALAGLLSSTVAHNIQLSAHGRECFHEQLHKDDKMTVTFQVGDREFGGAGNLEIDFWVCMSGARGDRNLGSYLHGSRNILCFNPCGQG